MSEGHPPGRRLVDDASSGRFLVDLYLLDAEFAGSLMALEEDIHMVAFDGAAGVLTFFPCYHNRKQRTE